MRKPKALPFVLGLIVSPLTLTLCSNIARAEDLNELLARVDKFVKEENFSKALGELKWAQAELEKKQMLKLQSFFPDELMEYKGKKLEQNSALGFMELKREYEKDGNSITVSLMGGAGGSGGPGGSKPMGQIAQFGQMAAMFGGGNDQETIRIKGRTTTMKKGEAGELTLFLDSGSMLKLESSNVASEELKGLAEKLDIDGIEKYLKG